MYVSLVLIRKIIEAPVLAHRSLYGSVDAESADEIG